MQNILHPSALIEEISFSVPAATPQDLAVIDTLDWWGALSGDFSDNRAFGWPLLDLGVRTTAGTVNINILALNPNFPINNTAPTFASEDTVQTFPVAAASWLEETRRLTSRFYRVQIEQTGGVDPATGTLFAFLRAQ